MKRFTPALVAGLVLVFVDLGAQGGTITGQVLVRERANGDQSLLVGVDTAQPIDRLEFTLPRRFEFVPGYVPDTWTFAQDGRRLTLSGAPTLRLSVRLDAKASENLMKNLSGREVELKVGAPGASRTTTVTAGVRFLPRVRLRDDWAALASHIFPPEVTRGAPVLGSPAPGFTDGVWIATSRETEAAEALKRAQAHLSEYTKGPPAGAQRLLDWTKVFDEVAEFESPKFNFFDRWLELTLETRPEVAIVPAETCSPGITGGTPVAFAGKDACVRGCFGTELTDLEKAAVMLLDGNVDVPVRAASPTTVVVGIPDNLMPGPHSLTSSGVPGQLTLDILLVQGSIDQTQLWRGESTTMRLQILGTERPIPLRIINRTPATIQIEGGDSQVLTTSGGAVNVLTRQVRGIMKGDFTIDYAVDQPPCGSGR